MRILKVRNIFFRTVAADIHIQLKNYESQFPKISINILFTYNFIVLLIFLWIELRNKNAYGGITRIHEYENLLYYNNIITPHTGI